MMKHAFFISVAIAAAALPAVAEPVEIVTATAQQEAGLWTFDVTLRHPDTGWDHYADAWEVLSPDGASLGLRTLTHPHVDEQPFTRSLSGIASPAGVSHVTIRARCLVDGWSGETLRVALGP
ncbi:MAG: hypothetical protein ACRC6I_02415 [Paracoccaceae bacterium]